MLNNDVFEYIIAPLIVGLFCFLSAEFCFKEPKDKSEKRNRLMFFCFGIICFMLQTLGAFIIISNCLQ